MKIDYDQLKFLLTLTDEERAKWLDGVKLYWEMSRDDRPEFNVYEYFENAPHQSYYQLDRLARELPLNQVPEEIVKGLEALKTLQVVCDTYASHVLGLLLKEKIK